MSDQIKEVVWVELEEAIGACSLCIHANICKQMKTHAKHCFAAKYRFRCPIEVLDERLKEQKMNKEINRFYIDGVDVILTEDGNEVVLLVEGHDIPPNNRFKKYTPKHILEQYARMIVQREKARGL